MFTADKPAKLDNTRQLVLWIISGFIILTALSIVIGLKSILAVNPAYQSFIPKSYQWFVGLTSFLIGSVLLIRAPSIWEAKRVRDLRNFGPNLWIQVGLALGLCGLIYVFSTAKIIPGITTKWELFTLLITLALASGLLAFGIMMLLLLAVEECFKTTINQIHLLLQDSAYQHYDLTDTVRKKLQELPDLDISMLNNNVRSTNWDEQNGIFTLVNRPENKNGSFW